MGSKSEWYAWADENLDDAERIVKNLRREQGRSKTTAGETEGDEDRRNGGKKLASPEQLADLVRRYPAMHNRGF